MRTSEAHQYVTQSKRRTLVVKHLTQPMTATQLSRRAGLNHDACRRILGELAGHGILSCLNPDARRSRVYWFTQLGLASIKRLANHSLSEDIDYSTIHWNLYGWVCYRHRAAVLKTMTEPMQPATIKRKARSRDPTLRMSANNTRDIMRLFRERGIVQPVYLRKKAHARYELTETGKTLQRLLIQTDRFA